MFNSLNLKSLFLIFIFISFSCASNKFISKTGNKSNKIFQYKVYNLVGKKKPLYSCEFPAEKIINDDFYQLKYLASYENNTLTEISEIKPEGKAIVYSKDNYLVYDKGFFDEFNIAKVKILNIKKESIVVNNSLVFERKGDFYFYKLNKNYLYIISFKSNNKSECKNEVIKKQNKYNFGTKVNKDTEFTKSE